MRSTIIIAFVFAIGVQVVYSQFQPVQLEVFAVCAYLKPVEGHKISIKFAVDKTNCDPEIGFISMEDRVYHFDDSIKAKGINFSDFERSLVNANNSATREERIYSYIGSEQQISDIITLCKNQEIEIKNLSKQLVKQELEAQDDYAICALNKAITKAQLIAESLGYNNCKLISIDDDTRGKGRSSGLMSIIDEFELDPSTVLERAGAYSIIGYFEAY